VLRVLLPSFDEEDEELVAGEEDVCIVVSWALLFVVVGVMPSLPALVGMEYESEVAVSAGI
jgi:hypothetical protein